jgi:hypothetical protein
MDVSSELCEWAKKAYRSALPAKQQNPTLRSPRRFRYKKANKNSDDLIV